MDELEKQLDKISETFHDLPLVVQDAILIAVALFLIWVVQRMLRGLLIRSLRRLTQHTSNHWDNQIMEFVDNPLRFIMLALGLEASILLLGFSADVKTVINNLALSLIFVAIVVFIYQLISRATQTTYLLHQLSGLEIEPALLPFIRTAIRVVLIAIGVAVVLEQWGYDVSTLVAGLGIGGLAFALAAQATLANLFGFTTIVGDDPLHVGEFIVTPDVTGTIEQVGIRSTRVRQLDQALVTVPNSTLADSVILNWSRLQKRQLNMTIGVTYDTDSSQMRALLTRLREMLKVRELVDEESVVVYFTQFGNSSLDILIRCYIFIADWAQFQAEKEEINLSIMDIVSELGLSMAFPSRSVYLENLSPQLRDAMPTLAKSPKVHQPPAKPYSPTNVPSDMSNEFPDAGESDQGQQGEDGEADR